MRLKTNIITFVVLLYIHSLALAEPSGYHHRTVTLRYLTDVKRWLIDKIEDED